VECGESSVIPEKLKKFARPIERCVGCGAIMGVLVKSRFDPFYSVGDFIELSRVDEELERLENHIELVSRNPGREGTLEALIMCNNLLWKLCRAKRDEASEVADHLNRDEVNKWEDKVDDYFRRFTALALEKLKRSRRRDWGDRGDRYPYPYVFKPPEPPDDIGVRTNVQRNRREEKKKLDVELFCMYCGSKLAMDERFCSVCGKKS